MITLADAEYPVHMSEIQIQNKSHKESFTRRPHRPLLRLMYSCSLRMGETLALPPAYIKSDESLIYIRGGKSVKDRRVPLASQIQTEICKYHKTYQSVQYPFESQQGGQYRYGNMNVKGISMAHYQPNENDSDVKYAYINELPVIKKTYEYKFNPT